MNVSDYLNSTEFQNYMSSGFISGIFNLQDQLIDAYVEIEAKNCPTNMYNIHRHLKASNPTDQQIVKILVQRVLEELGESAMAEYENNEEHVKEEIIDSIIFATELMILLDIRPDEINEEEIFYSYTFESVNRGDVYDYYGSATNLLKNKTWKLEAVPVDLERFHKRIIKAYEKHLIYAMKVFGSEGISLFAYFYGKWATNKFRQKSNY